MNKISLFQLFGLLIISALFTTACTDDDDNDGSDLQGDLRVELTDSPIDDPDVSAVFVTVADVRIDGESWDGFTGKTTIDLMAYQNGRTELIGDGSIDAESYNSLELVLDYEEDASGNSPGCYVEKMDGSKKQLRTDDSTLEANKDFTVEANQSSDIVIDFDLRKAVQRSDDAQEEYRFVAQSNLEAALRVVNKAEAGSIEGDISDDNTNSDRIVVYAYAAGSFNRMQEMQENSNGLRFQNAVSSTVVANDGSYNLSFLESGDYELVFASYRDDDNDGETELQGSLELNLLSNLGLNLSSLSVESQTSLEVDVQVTGLLPF